MEPSSSTKQPIFYGWVVVAVTLLCLFVTFGVRSAPGALIKPLEADFAWTRAQISFSVMIGLFATGLAAPFGGALMDRLGPRRVMLSALGLLSLSVAASAAMHHLWQMTLIMGFLTGIATGSLSALSASVANRWFVERRGTVQGILGSGISVGQIVMVPLMVWIISLAGWRITLLVVAAMTLALVPLVAIFMRDSPASIGLLPFGVTAQSATPPGRPRSVREVMGRAIRVSDFWLLGGSFFICGATSTGLIGIHFIAHATDHGIAQVTAASTFALMGAMSFAGALGSGWLTDRHDPRKLLACYYTFRGISLFALPFLTGSGFVGLSLFAVLFGLDYVATVPPTVALCADIFGRKNVGLIYGWVFCAHQLGAGLAAYLAGWAHDRLGDYTVAFIGAGGFAVVASLMALRIDRAPLPEPGLAGAAAAGAAD